MANKIIKTEKGVVTIRLEGAMAKNPQYLVESFEDTGRYFGEFKFEDSEETKKTLIEAVKMLDVDSQAKTDFFSGEYPKWIKDEKYGESLKASNRVHFYSNITSGAEIPNEKIKDYVYSLEVHLSKTKKDDIYLRIPRAIMSDVVTPFVNDDLFREDDENMFG